MLTPGQYLLAVLLAAMAAYLIAHRKGLNAPGWAWATLILIVPILLLPFVKSRRPVTAPAVVLDDARWDALAAYDPAIKASVERLSLLGQGPVAELRRLYARVPDKAALPAIVAEVERKWRDYRSLGLIQVETREGVDIMRDATGRYHVEGRRTADLATARTMADVAARRARGA